MSISPRDAAALDAYIAARFPGASVSALMAGPTGSSNDTYFLSVASTDGTDELVLRTQTSGHQLFLDADVLLQARVMRALGPVGLPVPEVLFQEPDPSLAGSPFFVMRRVAGRSLPVTSSFHREGWLADAAPADRAVVWRNAVDAIAAVGRTDWREGLSWLSGAGEPGLDSYLGWVERWSVWAARGRPHPTVDVALGHVRAWQPARAPVELVWGDATLGNMLFADDLSVAAVLDWEMAALGPAELDLGWFLFMDDMYSSGMGIPRLAGLPSHDETATRFAEQLGRPVQDIAYYQTVAALRMAIIVRRFADIQIGYGTLPPDATLGTDNPATNVLAAYLGLDRPADSGVLDLATRAAAQGRRGRD